jgi:ATP-dependent Clp protease adaptor protein ClpS
MGNQQQRSGSEHGSVLEAEKTRLKPPPLYKVLLLNDDYTPMDFVVIVLQTVFGMTREKATQVMLQVHREGMGVCGTYTREVAAAKVDQVIDIARKHQHPLQCTMEET